MLVYILGIQRDIGCETSFSQHSPSSLRLPLFSYSNQPQDLEFRPGSVNCSPPTILRASARSTTANRIQDDSHRQGRFHFNSSAARGIALARGRCLAGGGRRTEGVRSAVDCHRGLHARRSSGRYLHGPSSHAQDLLQKVLTAVSDQGLSMYPPHSLRLDYTAHDSLLQISLGDEFLTVHPIPLPPNLSIQQNCRAWLWPAYGSLASWRNAPVASTSSSPSSTESIRGSSRWKTLQR